MTTYGRVLEAGADMVYGNSRGFGGQGGQITSAFASSPGGAGIVTCDIQMR